MKYITVFILLISATLAFPDVAGLLSRNKEDWKFIQSVGGMSATMKDSTLIVDCDVSGMKTVTVKPTMINSGMGVRELKHKRDGNTILLTLVTCVIGKDVKTTPKPVDLSDYPAGEYSIQYLDPDGTRHAVGKVTLEKKKEGKSPLSR